MIRPQTGISGGHVAWQCATSSAMRMTFHAGRDQREIGVSPPVSSPQDRGADANPLACLIRDRADDSLGPFTLTEWPLILALAEGGLPLVAELSWKLLHHEFGSDLLAGISIVTSESPLVILRLFPLAEAAFRYVRRAEFRVHRLRDVRLAVHRRLDSQTHSVQRSERLDRHRRRIPVGRPHRVGGGRRTLRLETPKERGRNNFP